MAWLWIWFLAILWAIAFVLAVLLAYTCQICQGLRRNVMRVKSDYRTLQAKLDQMESQKFILPALLPADPQPVTTIASTPCEAEVCQPQKRQDIDRSVRFAEVNHVNEPPMDSTEEIPIHTPPKAMPTNPLALTSHTVQPSQDSQSWGTWLKGLVLGTEPAVPAISSNASLSDLGNQTASTHSPQMPDKGKRSMVRSCSAVSEAGFFTADTGDAISEAKPLSTVEMHSAQGDDEVKANEETDAFADCAESESNSEGQPAEETLLYRVVIAAESCDRHRQAMNGIIGTLQYLHLCEELESLLEDLGGLLDFFHSLAQDMQRHIDALRGAYHKSRQTNLAQLAEESAPTCSPLKSKTVARCITHLQHILNFFDAFLVGLQSPAESSAMAFAAAYKAHLVPISYSTSSEHFHCASPRQSFLTHLAPTTAYREQYTNRYSAALRPISIAISDVLCSKMISDEDLCAPDIA